MRGSKFQGFLDFGGGDADDEIVQVRPCPKTMAHLWAQGTVEAEFKVLGQGSEGDVHAEGESWGGSWVPLFPARVHPQLLVLFAHMDQLQGGMLIELGKGSGSTWGGSVHRLESDGTLLKVESGGTVDLYETQPHHVGGCLGGLAHDFRPPLGLPPPFGRWPDERQWPPFPAPWGRG